MALALLLFTAACLGHLTLMVASHNWCYGQPLPKRAGDFFHLTHALLVLAFPVLLFWVGGWDPLTLFAPTSGPSWRWLLALYVSLCWLSGLVLLPIDTLRRLARCEPITELRSEIVDGARELGSPPRGSNRQRWMTRLPGNEVFEVELAEKTLTLPRLPAAWEGLRLLHLSDLHLNGTPDRDWFRLVLDRCNAWEPDLVAVTGDIADSIYHHRWIIPVLGRLRWRLGAFAILGNHDFWYDPPLIRRRLRRLRLRVLANTWEQVEVRGEPLVVIGHEGPWFRPAPDLAGCPEGPFRLLLSHTPDNIRWARGAGVDLMLSGHVHGGQIRFPVFGSMLVPSTYGRAFDRGAFDMPPTLLHVSRGLSGEHPLRFGCRPEATLLVLRRGGSASS